MSVETAWRWMKSVAVLVATFNAGFNLGLFSPTLPDIQVLTSSTTAQMSTTLIWTGVAGMMGAMMLGPMFDKFDGMLVLAIALFFQAVSFGLASFFRVLIGYQMMIAVGALFNIGLLTGTMSVNCIIWKDNPEMISPILQITDLIHALGSAVTPQIIAPFLGKFPESERLDPANATGFTDNASSTGFTAGSNSSSEGGTTYWGIQPVQMAYVITGVFDGVAALVCFIVFVLDRGRTTWKSYEYDKNRILRSRSYSMNEDGSKLLAEEFSELSEARERASSLMRVRGLRNNSASTAKEAEQSEKAGNDVRGLRKVTLRKNFQEELSRRRNSMQVEEIGAQKDPKSAAKTESIHGGSVDSSVPFISCNFQMILLMVIIFGFFLCNGGRDAMMIGLLYTYLEVYLHWGPRAGTLMVTLYHVTRVVIHALFVFLSKRLSPAVLTVVNIVTLLLAGALMLGTVYASQAFVGISVILTGFATSNLHPTAITLVQRSFQVTGRIMGILYAAISGGQIVFAPLLCQFLQNKGAVAFPAFLFALSVATAILFIPWLVMARVVKKIPFRRSKQERDVEKIIAKKIKNNNNYDSEKTPLMGC